MYIIVAVHLRKMYVIIAGNIILGIGNDYGGPYASKVHA